MNLPDKTFKFAERFVLVLFQVIIQRLVNRLNTNTQICQSVVETSHKFFLLLLSRSALNYAELCFFIQRETLSCFFFSRAEGGGER